MLAPRTGGSAFEAPSFTLVWLSGLVWHLTRWGVAFLGTYLINELTGSPRLVQLAGTMLYGPLLIGGLVGGVISDRVDRLLTVRAQLVVLIPLSIALGLVVRADQVEVWMIYGYMFIVGIGWVTDMTSRRALVFDLVGDARIDHAMALEAMSLSIGLILGALVGGSAVAAVGIGAAYFWIAGSLVLALCLLAPVRAPATRAAAPAASPVRDLVDGIRDLRRRSGVVSVLVVTALANFFLFAYFPIVPVVADRLDAAPVLVGLLLAGTGIGMLIGSLVIARQRPRRRGLVYVGGLLVAFVFLVPFAVSTSYPLALLAIVASGVGSGFFGSTQSTLVMASAPVELRGRALGLLSMAIGALPVGMYALGELAERVGVTGALVFNACAGAGLLLLWSIRRPELVAMTVDDRPAERGPADHPVER